MSQFPGLTNLSHHAYLLLGSSSTSADLIAFLEKGHGFKVRGNPDFTVDTYESFNIENARQLKMQAEMRPTENDAKKIFIICADSITSEAQNALLKLFEEPPEYAIFFLIIPSAHLLLGTLKSRLLQIEGSNSHSTGNSAKINRGSNGDGDPVKNSGDVISITSAPECSVFIKASKPKRLQMIKELLDDISKEKRSKREALELLDGIEAIIYEDKGVRNARKSLEAIEFARRYMNDRAPSLKMLLEYVALELN